MMGSGILEALFTFRQRIALAFSGVTMDDLRREEEEEKGKTGRSRSASLCLKDV